MTLARIIAIAVLTHMAFVAARMTASLYALANDASTFTVGVIMALFALVPMLTGVRAGRWLDAVGPWRPTLTGTLLMLGGTLLPALFPYATADVAPLLVAAAMIGHRPDADDAVRAAGGRRARRSEPAARRFLVARAGRFGLRVRRPGA